METTVEDMLIIIGELTVQLRATSSERDVLRAQLEAISQESVEEPTD